MRILVIDDDPTTWALFTALKPLLPDHQLMLANDIAQSRSDIEVAPIDIALLNIVTPAANGFEVLQLLRQEPNCKLTYIILISEDRTQLLDRLWAYHLQAQDFIAKPFDMHELQLMLRSKVAYLEYQKNNQLRLEQGHFQTGPYQLHPEQRTLSSPRGVISLSEMEYRLLNCFFAHTNQWLSLEYLITEVWKDKEQSYFITAANLRSLIYKVRLKIEADPSNPIFILQSRHTGYMFCPQGNPRNVL